MNWSVNYNNNIYIYIYIYIHVFINSLGSHIVVEYCSRNAMVQLLRLLLGSPHWFWLRRKAVQLYDFREVASCRQ